MLQCRVEGDAPVQTLSFCRAVGANVGQASSLGSEGEKHCWSPLWRKFPGFGETAGVFEFEAVNPLVQITRGSTHQPRQPEFENLCSHRFSLTHFPFNVYLLKVKHTSALNSQTSADAFVNSLSITDKNKSQNNKKNIGPMLIQTVISEWGRKSEKFEKHYF